MSNGALKHILDAAKARTEDYERGLRDGRAQALQEVQPQITKISAAAVQSVLKELEDLEAFRGQVMIHAGGREIARMKESMAAGMCWDCGVRAPVPTSPYRRCDSCDKNAQGE